MATKKETSPEIVVERMQRSSITFAILGSTPLIYHAVAQKAKEQLLLPSVSPNRAERATRLKHDPVNEFRNSLCRDREHDTVTYLQAPTSWFKGGLMTAALRLPGTRRTEIGQLVWVSGQWAPMYGIPQLFMTVVRSADINRTPDIRTRAILPKWATTITITFAEPLLNETTIATLLDTAGYVSGVGDGRPEKGKLNFGQFDIVAADDPRHVAIMAQCGRAAQLAAYEDPATYDDETDTLLEWFHEEIVRRGRKLPAPDHDEEEIELEMTEDGLVEVAV